MLLDLGDLKVRSWRKDDLKSLCATPTIRRLPPTCATSFPILTRGAMASIFWTSRGRKSRSVRSPSSMGAKPSAAWDFIMGRDIARISAEMGYWLSEEFWGRGIATRAVDGHVGVGLRQLQADARVRDRVSAQCGVDPGAGEGRVRARRIDAAERDQERG